MHPATISVRTVTSIMVLFFSNYALKVDPSDLYELSISSTTGVNGTKRENSRPKQQNIILGPTSEPTRRKSRKKLNKVDITQPSFVL